MTDQRSWGLLVACAVFTFIVICTLAYRLQVLLGNSKEAFMQRRATTRKALKELDSQLGEQCVENVRLREQLRQNVDQLLVHEKFSTGFMEDLEAFRSGSLYAKTQKIMQREDILGCALDFEGGHCHEDIQHGHNDLKVLLENISCEQDRLLSEMEWLSVVERENRSLLKVLEHDGSQCISPQTSAIVQESESAEIENVIDEFVRKAAYVGRNCRPEGFQGGHENESVETCTPPSDAAELSFETKGPLNEYIMTLKEGITRPSFFTGLDQRSYDDSSAQATLQSNLTAKELPIAEFPVFCDGDSVLELLCQDEAAHMPSVPNVEERLLAPSHGIFTMPSPRIEAAHQASIEENARLLSGIQERSAELQAARNNLCNLRSKFRCAACGLEEQYLRASELQQRLQAIGVHLHAFGESVPGTQSKAKDKIDQQKSETKAHEISKGGAHDNMLVRLLGGMCTTDSPKSEVRPASSNHVNTEDGRNFTTSLPNQDSVSRSLRTACQSASSALLADALSVLAESDSSQDRKSVV